jgi:hypothetical protein
MVLEAARRDATDVLTDMPHRSGGRAPFLPTVEAPRRPGGTGKRSRSRGPHFVSLEAVDARGAAVFTQDHQITVTGGAACLVFAP